MATDAEHQEQSKKERIRRVQTLASPVTPVPGQDSHGLPHPLGRQISARVLLLKGPPDCDWPTLGVPNPVHSEAPFSGSEIDVRPILVQCELAPAAESGGDCLAQGAPAWAKLGPRVNARPRLAPSTPPPIALTTSPHPPSCTAGWGHQLLGVRKRPALGAPNL